MMSNLVQIMAWCRLLIGIDLDIYNSFKRSQLTVNVRGPSYLGLTRSISWLLMPWLLASPGHQQP